MGHSIDQFKFPGLDILMKQKWFFKPQMLSSPFVMLHTRNAQAGPFEKKLERFSPNYFFLVEWSRMDLYANYKTRLYLLERFKHSSLLL
jgi:hypothetical protein